jgi:F-type H+-transporting ATPase subunit b
MATNKIVPSSSMRLSLTSAILTALPAAPLLAQEEHAGPPNLLDPHYGLMVWTLVIFVILLFILSRYAFKPLTRAVAEREAALEEAIASAKRDREEAQRLLEEQRAGVAKAHADAQQLIAEGRAVGERIRAEMLEETRKQQEDLLARARKEIESEKVRAIQQLRAEAVELAIAGASKVIEKNLDDQTNRKLVDSFLSTVSTATRR